MTAAKTERNQALLDAWRLGATAAALGEQYGLRMQVVCRILRRLVGGSLRQPGTGRDLLSLDEVARRLGHSHTGLARLARGLGMRPSGRAWLLTPADVARLCRAACHRCRYCGGWIRGRCRTHCGAKTCVGKHKRYTDERRCRRPLPPPRRGAGPLTALVAPLVAGLMPVNYLPFRMAIRLAGLCGRRGAFAYLVDRGLIHCDEQPHLRHPRTGKPIRYYSRVHCAAIGRELGRAATSPG